MRDDLYMLRLLGRHLPFRRRHSGGYCVLRFPDATESRWFDQLPRSGTRIRSQQGGRERRQVWIVDEVLQSGRNTYTVFCVGRGEYLDGLRRGHGGTPDLGAELLDVARRTNESVTEKRRRWKRRHYLP